MICDVARGLAYLLSDSRRSIEGGDGTRPVSCPMRGSPKTRAHSSSMSMERLALGCVETHDCSDAINDTKECLNPPLRWRLSESHFDSNPQSVGPPYSSAFGGTAVLPRHPELHLATGQKRSSGFARPSPWAKHSISASAHSLIAKVLVSGDRRS
jgi:hypothetical protein